MTQLDVRNITNLTARIHVLNEQGVKVSIEIGQCLEQAKKEFLSHEDWLTWAESEFGYKKSHVYRLVAIGKEFPSGGNFQNYSVKKLYALVGTDEEFRESTHVVPGTDDRKTIDEMSAREIEKVKREKAEAERRAQEMEQRAKQAEQDARHWQGVAKSQPVRVQTQVVEKVPDDYEELKEQATIAQRLNSENVILQRKMQEMKQEFNEKTQRQDEVNHAIKKLRESFKNLLMITSQEHHNAKFFYDQIPGNVQAQQAVQSFLNEYGTMVSEMFAEWKKEIEIKTVS